MTLSNLNDLFIHELKDVLDAEHQLVETLPKMADAAADPELALAFQEHLRQTERQVTRLESVFAALGEDPEPEPCEGMEGLIEEGTELMEQDAEPAVRDAALIAAAQRVEHYEIAAYGTLRVWAATLGLDEVIGLLEQNLEEEKAADQKLTMIAEGSVNIEAETEPGEAEEVEEAEATPAAAREEGRPAPTRSTSKRTTASRPRTRARATKPARSSRRKTRAR